MSSFNLIGNVGISNGSNNGSGGGSIHGSGRFQLLDNLAWVGTLHATYGPNLHTFTQGGSTGADPNVQWEMIGDFVKAGTVISRLNFIARANSLEVTDFELYVMLLTPTPTTRWSSGYAADSQIVVTDLFRDVWTNAVENYSGGTSSNRLAKIDIDHTVVRRFNGGYFYKTTRYVNRHKIFTRNLFF